MYPIKKRILCVDDHEDTCEILSALLSRRGFEVVTAQTPVTALLICRGQPFNLYVLDAQFWGDAGARLCRSIREFDPPAPIIFFTAMPEEQARGEALEAGATRYVLKPDVRGLVEAVVQDASKVSPDAAGRLRATSY